MLIGICLIVMGQKNRVKKDTRAVTNISRIDTVNNNIPEPILSKSNFRFVTAYPWLKSTNNLYKKYKFTNFLRNSEEYSKKVTELIEEIILKINSDSEELFKRDSKHCHSLKGHQLEIVQEISKELIDNDFKQATDEKDYVWWQIGFKGSTRLIGILSKSNNCFYPIFVDWHHLLFSSEKYNSFDYKKYNYNPHD